MSLCGARCCGITFTTMTLQWHSRRPLPTDSIPRAAMGRQGTIAGGYKGCHEWGTSTNEGMCCYKHSQIPHSCWCIRVVH